MLSVNNLNNYHAIEDHCIFSYFKIECSSCCPFVEIYLKTNGMRNNLFLIHVFHSVSYIKNWGKAYIPSPCATQTPRTLPTMLRRWMAGVGSMRTVDQRHSNLPDLLCSNTTSGFFLLSASFKQISFHFSLKLIITQKVNIFRVIRVLD